MLSTHFVILNQTFVVILGTNDIKMLRKHPQKKTPLVVVTGVFIAMSGILLFA